MDFVTSIDPAQLKDMPCLAESDQFAIHSLGNDTYLLVQRHGSRPWTALRLSGDGLFRVGGLFVEAMRHLYRDVASDLSPNRRG